MHTSVTLLLGSTITFQFVVGEKDPRHIMRISSRKVTSIQCTEFGVEVAFDDGFADVFPWHRIHHASRKL